MVKVIVLNNNLVGVQRKQLLGGIPAQKIGRVLPKCCCKKEGQFQGSFEGRGYGRGGSGNYDNYAKWSQYTKIDPIDFWTDLIDLQDELVGAMGGSRVRRRGSKTPPASTRKEDGTVTLPADFQDSDEKQYVIYADIPGLTKEDIKVQLGKDNELMISGERTKLSDRPSERFFGKFSRTFILPEDADTSTITANVENGSLTITINKIIEITPEEQFKDIPIL
eukprot:TRINITY_DN17020_c0_g1_i1.p1 TRINITY_DN17020_c0_g1~~TRINITY_DN17020_c0_g1_i1.p1  ORF type:complete len:222 (-),score=38.66 TRINITY_DN17020_c0_g1_i1:299-964(-)